MFRLTETTPAHSMLLPSRKEIQDALPPDKPHHPLPLRPSKILRHISPTSRIDHTLPCSPPPPGLLLSSSFFFFFFFNEQPLFTLLIPFIPLGGRPLGFSTSVWLRDRVWTVLGSHFCSFGFQTIPLGARPRGFWPLGVDFGVDFLTFF